MPIATPAVDDATDAIELSPVQHSGAPIRQTKSRGSHKPRAADLLARLLMASYRVPISERPELAEDDYYRFRNQPRG